MDIGVIFDWMGRIFGIAFLLFMLFVLFFPSWNESTDGSAELTDERPERTGSQAGPSRLEPTPLHAMEHERGAVLIHLHRRRDHR